MANEINVLISLKADKGFLVVRDQPGALSFTMTGALVASGVQNIGTTAEALAVNDVTTCGWSYFRNTDATNYVELGTGTGGSFVGFARLKPGECGLIRLTTNAPTARANTSAVNLQYTILQD